MSSDLHTVRPGDSLSSIAKRVYGAEAEWPSIAKANGLRPPYVLLIGMKLRIPRQRQSVSRRPHSVIHESHDPHLRSRPPTGQPTLAAMEIGWPTCEVSIKAQEHTFNLPYGRVVLRLEGKVSLKKKGSFRCEMGARLTQAKSVLYAKVKTEYGNEFAKLISDVSFDPIKRELTFKCGWKFTNCAYEIKPPNTQVYSFFPQAVKLNDLSGEVKATVELTPNNRPIQPQSDLVAIKIPDGVLNFEVTPDETRNGLAFTGLVAAFWFAVETYGAMAIVVAL